MVNQYLFAEGQDCPGSPIKPNFQRVQQNALLGGTSVDGPSTPSRPFKSFFLFGSAMKTGSPFGRQKGNANKGASMTSGKNLSAAFNEASGANFEETADDEDAPETPYFETFDVTSLKDSHALLMKHIYRQSVQKSDDQK